MVDPGPKMSFQSHLKKESPYNRMSLTSKMKITNE